MYKQFCSLGVVLTVAQPTLCYQPLVTVRLPRSLPYCFLLCSYSKDLLDKVMEMADGIEVEDLPQFITRSELMKKVMSRGDSPSFDTVLCCFVHSCFPFPHSLSKPFHN